MGGSRLFHKERGGRRGFFAFYTKENLQYIEVNSGKQLSNTSGGSFTKARGACECWEFFRNSPVEAQKQLIPFKGKGSKQSTLSVGASEPAQNQRRIVPDMEKQTNIHWDFKGIHQCMQR